MSDAARIQTQVCLTPSQRRIKARARAGAGRRVRREEGVPACDSSC